MFLPISELVDEAAETLRQKLRNVATKRTEMCRVEKHSWRMVDDTEMHADSMKCRVDEIVRQKVCIYMLMLQSRAYSKTCIRELASSPSFSFLQSQLAKLKLLLCACIYYECMSPSYRQQNSSFMDQRSNRWLACSIEWNKYLLYKLLWLLSDKESRCFQRLRFKQAINI